MVHTTGKRVAIIGGGFGGLTTGVKMAPFCQTIHIYDPLPVGKAGASSAAAGLMHPFSPSGQLTWNGMANYRAAKAQFEYVEKLTKQRFTFPNIKVIRTIFKPEDHVKWTAAHNTHISEAIDDTGSMTGLLTQLPLESFLKHYRKEVPGEPQPSILSAFQINPSMIIDSEKYLNASWTAINAICSDCKWFQHTVTDDLQPLCGEYDEVIVAAGFGSPLLWKRSLENVVSKDDIALKQLSKTHYDKGITILLEPNLSTPATEEERAAFVFGDYIVPTLVDGKVCFVGGATHDRITLTSESIQSYLNPLETNHCNDLIQPEEETRLREALQPILPEINSMKTLKRRQGIRLKTANQPKVGRVPIVGRHPTLKNVWILTGFGVRGLLFHAHSADLLVQAIFHQNEHLIPAILHPSAH